MSKVSAAISALAVAYDKPINYVEAAIRVHNVDVSALPAFRTPNDGFNGFFSDLTAYFNMEPSLTKQEFTAECDINVIMRRFAASGFDPSTLPMNARKALYGDFTGYPDSYHDALNYVRNTEQSFMTLEASLRARFDNDPQKFLDFVADPKNFDELVKLGIAVAPAKPLETPPVHTGAEGGSKGKVSKKPVLSASNAVSDPSDEGGEGE